MYIGEMEDGENNLGLLKHLRKLHKKVTKPLRKIEKKVLPKKLVKAQEKIEKKVDKLSENKTLNKISNVAAAAVATWVAGPAAAGALQSALVGAGKKAVIEGAVKKGVKRVNKLKSRKAQKAEKKRLNKEIKQLQASLDNPASLTPEQRDQAAQAVMAETAALRQATNIAVPQAVQNLTPEVQNYIQQKAAADPTWLKSSEALQLMEPAIKSASGGIASQVSDNPLAQQAAEQNAENAIDETVAKKDWSNLLIPAGVVIAGGLLLYAMNRRK